MQLAIHGICQPNAADPRAPARQNWSAPGCPNIRTPAIGRDRKEHAALKASHQLTVGEAATGSTVVGMLTLGGGTAAGPIDATRI